MKKLLLLSLSLIAVCIVLFLVYSESEKPNQKITKKTLKIASQEGEHETPEERAIAVEERFLYEFHRQVNPLTGEIPRSEKVLEFDRSIRAKLKTMETSSAKTIQTTYTNRGPSNFGGRTRALAIDKTNSNIILAGGVSSGVFRTTDGGANWTKVSPNNEIHNVTTIAQDPRSGFENIWYYGTGESIGNSASLRGSAYFGQGIWKSTDGGITWAQMPTTASNQTVFDSEFDFIFKLAVHPTTGHLYAALAGSIKRFNGSTWSTELFNSSIGSDKHTDVVITPGGRVYAGFSGTNDTNRRGVWTSPTGVGGYTRISTGIFTPTGRVVLGLAPSNPNKLFVLFDNGNVGDCPTAIQEADLWMWNQSNTTFTDYSSKLPDEGNCYEGINPFSIQGGYDLVVSVKPDNENFVVIGGTNAYKMANITGVGSFARIGGYALSNDTQIYANHHPDIHALVFDPNNTSLMYTGTDGGVHKTTDVNALNVSWTSLNNNYQTIQYYHVGIDPLVGSDAVIGGTQDNGTPVGGTEIGAPDLTTQYTYLGGDGFSVGISRDHECIPYYLSVYDGRIFRDCPITPFNLGPEDEITPDGSVSSFVTLFHLDQDNNNNLYYAGRGALYRTADATNVTSSNWVLVGSPPGFGTDEGDPDPNTREESFQAFSTSWGTYNASTSYLLMGGDMGHIYRLDDPQNASNMSSAVNITPSGATTVTAPNYSIVTGLAIDPTDNNRVLATYSNYGSVKNIFLTTNATSPSPTWTEIERNLSAHSIRSAAIVEDNGEITYFVGTARGLYSSPDPTTTDWVLEASTDIGFALVSDLKYRPADHKLLIGTHGNGMYEATISSTLGLEDFNNISSVIKLYPNPVHNDLNVKIPQTDGINVSHSVVNLSGQMMFSGILDKEILDVSALSPGMYFIQIKTNDGRIGAKSFIKK